MEASGTRPKLPFSKDPQGSSALSRTNSATRTFHYENFLTDSVSHRHTPIKTYSNSQNVTFDEIDLIDNYPVSIDNENSHEDENKFTMTRQENDKHPIVKSK